jgi:signal transduction histidine kinase
VFLAFKEAVHNVVLHAAATEVRVRLAHEPPGIVLTVQDDGRGFDAGQAGAGQGLREPGVPGASAGGNGLFNMRKRLEEIGGQCQVESGPGRGTTVRFTIPLPTRT